MPDSYETAGFVAENMVSQYKQ